MLAAPLLKHYNSARKQPKVDYKIIRFDSFLFKRRSFTRTLKITPLLLKLFSYIAIIGLTFIKYKLFYMDDI
jgi:hypothetical protein